MTIGENIKRIRTQKGLTQKELGKLSGINEVQIRRYEIEKAIPQIETLTKIATALNVSLMQLTKSVSFSSFLNPLDELHENLYILRYKSNLSKKELSEKLGIPEGEYSLYENGKRIPLPYVLEKIASFYEISKEELVGITETNSRKRRPLVSEKDIEKQITENNIEQATGYFLKILKAYYGNIELKTHYNTKTNESENYYILGFKGEQFILHENDINTLYQSILAFIPTIVDRLKEPIDL